jgi:hypothetical protein
VAVDTLQFVTSPAREKYMVSLGPDRHRVPAHASNPAGGGLGLAIGAMWSRFRANRAAWGVDVALLDSDNRPTGGVHHEHLADQASAEQRVGEIMEAIGSGHWPPST